jgi:hypothetical protein
MAGLFFAFTPWKERSFALSSLIMSAMLLSFAASFIDLWHTHGHLSQHYEEGGKSGSLSAVTLTFKTPSTLGIRTTA